MTPVDFLQTLQNFRAFFSPFPSFLLIFTWKYMDPTLMHFPAHLFCSRLCVKNLCTMLNIMNYYSYLRGFSSGVTGKEPTYQCRRHKKGRFHPWVGKVPWRRKWQPGPVFLPGESLDQRNLVGLQSMGSHRVRHNKQLSMHTCTPTSQSCQVNLGK